MSDHIEDGGPAFPVVASNERTAELPHGHQVGSREWQMYGMTLRDYFAAKAIQGLLAMRPNVDGTPFRSGKHSDFVAVAAYGIADAMLKARTAP